jgi:UDP-N-acetylmuramate--alanine ligase
VLLTEVYAAGEAPIAGADGRRWRARCAWPAACPCSSCADVAALPAPSPNGARDGDVVITMGAGSIGGCRQVVDLTLLQGRHNDKTT